MILDHLLIIESGGRGVGSGGGGDGDGGGIRDPLNVAFSIFPLSRTQTNRFHSDASLDRNSGV